MNDSFVCCVELRRACGSSKCANQRSAKSAKRLLSLLALPHIGYVDAQMQNILS
jgi:hypothetical protein